LVKLAELLDEIQDGVNTRSLRRAGVVQEINRVLTENKVGTKIGLLALSRLTGTLPSGASGGNAYSGVATRVRSIDEDSITSDFLTISIFTSKGLPFSVDDGSAIEFEIYPGVWKSSADLSAGQKSTAVLPLLLMAAPGPIILDQPEDNLDNKYIGGTVVRMIEDRKFKNQMVLTSHNASIVVMSDCELIIEMADEGNQGRVRVGGFLAGPDSAIAGSVLDILDGGREALLSRFKKYGRLVEAP
jgi:hypothetical protein